MKKSQAETTDPKESELDAKAQELAQAIPVPYADPSEVADFAASLSESFLQCRELGHNWKPWTVRWLPEEVHYERALKCSRCHTERWQALTDRGAVLSGHYVYPDGYVVQGLGRIVGEGRDALRLESLTRALARVARQAKAAS